MNEQAANSMNAALSVDFVKADYFLDRIAAYEAKYHNQWENWGDFLAEYQLDKVDRNNLDFDEWAFLCQHFLADLILLDTGPPGDRQDLLQKPDSESGFCSFRKHYCLMPANISRMRYRCCTPARRRPMSSAAASQ